MAMSNKKYVQEKGFKCPFCLSQDVEDTFPYLRQENFTITIQVKCYDCLKQWNEVYAFTHYSEITP